MMSILNESHFLIKTYNVQLKTTEIERVSSEYVGNCSFNILQTNWNEIIIKTFSYHTFYI